MPRPITKVQLPLGMPVTVMSPKLTERIARLKVRSLPASERPSTFASVAVGKVSAERTHLDGINFGYGISTAEQHVTDCPGFGADMPDSCESDASFGVRKLPS